MYLLLFLCSIYRDYKYRFVYYGYTLIIHLLATENTLFQLYDNKLKNNKEIHDYKYV